jgi:ribosomal protein L33
MNLNNPLLVCTKCKGRSFLDRSTLDEEKIDFVCINCGNRNYVSPNSPSGQHIIRIEKERLHAYGS